MIERASDFRVSRTTSEPVNYQVCFDSSTAKALDEMLQESHNVYVKAHRSSYTCCETISAWTYATASTWGRFNLLFNLVNEVVAQSSSAVLGHLDWFIVYPNLPRCEELSEQDAYYTLIDEGIISDNIVLFIEQLFIMISILIKLATAAVGDD